VSVGVHPHAAHQYAANPARPAEWSEKQVSRTTRGARVCGEIGLDYHYRLLAERRTTTQVFRAQLVARSLFSICRL